MIEVHKRFAQQQGKFMNLLVTAGNTLVPIDRVRCITNIFTGRTGAGIALHAHNKGHTVTLLTSHPEVVAILTQRPPGGDRWHLHPYRTFEDLQALMTTHVQNAGLDGIIHCAAVSDYLAAGVYAPNPHTHFDPASARWCGEGDQAPGLVDRAAGKVKSDEPELWLRLVRSPKLVDRIRSDWGFTGLLVKFKLEVALNDEQLLDIAEYSRKQSDADLMVANTLEGASEFAYLGPREGEYQRVEREHLSRVVLETLESMHRERGHG